MNLSGMIRHPQEAKKVSVIQNPIPTTISGDTNDSNRSDHV